MGLSGWDYTGVGKEPALLGGWFAAPDPKGWQGFTRRYVETYGDAPPRLASLAYDAVSLAISLSNNPAGQRFVASELTRASGFQGVDGLFRLRPEGISERGFAIMEVQKYGNQVIEPAPHPSVPRLRNIDSLWPGALGPKQAVATHAGLLRFLIFCTSSWPNAQDRCAHPDCRNHPQVRIGNS